MAAHLSPDLPHLGAFQKAEPEARLTVASESSEGRRPHKGTHLSQPLLWAPGLNPPRALQGALGMGLRSFHPSTA